MIYIYIYIFNRIWVETRWQQYITHLHSNSTRNTEKVKQSSERKIGKCGPCPVFANYTLAFTLKLRKKHGKTSVRVAQYKNNEQQMSQNNKEHRIHNRENQTKKKHLRYSTTTC
jgi:hypothetical protein